MIDEIRERIRNKEQFIYNVKCMPIPSSTAITAKNVCMDEVAFLQEVLKKMEELQREHDLARMEVVVYGDMIRHKNARIELQQKEIAELKRTKDIAIEIQKNAIAELKSDLNLYIDLCDKKEEWLQYYKERAELAERSSDERTN